jgi:ubiquitin C-terminal hydrolase
LAERCLFGFFVKIYVDSERAPQNEIWYEPTSFLDHVFAEGLFYRGAPSDVQEFFIFLANALDTHSTRIASELHIPAFPSFCALFNTRVGGGFGVNVTDSHLVIPINLTDNIRHGLDTWMQPEDDQILKRFTQLGPCLAFHVNCYRFDEAAGWLVKRWDTIELQESLDIGDDNGMRHYELVGSVLHDGDDLQNGHYVCVVRICGTWVIADDNNLRGLGDEEVANFLLNGKVGGYDRITMSMAFYHQIGRE